jgi:Protein of unknown function (DUF2442)
MDKAHEVQSIAFVGPTMTLLVDGRKHEVNVVDCSERLAAATQDQRETFEVSPSGYGIHWPEIDEDLSFDGLIGVRHSSPAAETAP